MNQQKRELKTVDPRIIMINHYDQEDETLTLRLAIQKNNLLIFSYLWDTFGHLYSEKHLLILARYILAEGREDFAEALL